MFRSSLVVAAFAASLVAQGNAVPGTDILCYGLDSPNVYGRNDPPYPNGTAGVVIGHSMSNCGSIHLPWDGVIGGGVMQDQHVKIAFLLARESDGRMVQISGKSFCKHSRVAFNFSGNPPCFPCQTGPSNHFRIGCYDIYSAGFNGNRGNLGPTTEIDPWLGTWEPNGSYFDVGDPGQAGYPLPADNLQSLNTSTFDAVKNRMEVPEQELVQAGTFYGQNQVVYEGEPVANRDNNRVHRRLLFNWNGNAWGVNTTGSPTMGSVLESWTGATTSVGGNGNDDGRFMVAVKVTGPTNGMWHYEYAVHNLDNHRGAASLRIPVCAEAIVENVGFRDIDQDILNDWSVSRSGDELAFLAGANNPLDWNTFYNFYFDSSAAPVSGDVTLDAARPGGGAPTVAVATTVPSLLGAVDLGAGCGTPEPQIWANSAPTSPNAAFSIEAQVGADNFLLLVFAGSAANIPLGGGCTLLVDNTQILVSSLLQGDASGRVGLGVPIPAALAPFDFATQVIEFVPGAPFLGFGNASNGLLIRAAATGCR